MSKKEEKNWMPLRELAKEASRSDASEEASFQQTANDMKALLAAQPVVSIMVPLETGEPKGTQLPVTINGYR